MTSKAIPLSKEVTNIVQKTCGISKSALQKLLNTKRPVRDFVLYLNKTVQNKPFG